MLVLSRKEGQQIVLHPDGKVLSEEIRFNVEHIGKSVVQISIDAPSQIRIVRGELNQKD